MVVRKFFETLEGRIPSKVTIERDLFVFQLKYAIRLTILRRSPWTSSFWKMAVFRISLVKSSWPECLFTNVSLSSCMGHPGVREAVHMYNFILGLIAEHKNSFQFVPAENYSHMMEMSASGQADFSEYLTR